MYFERNYPSHMINMSGWGPNLLIGLLRDYTPLNVFHLITPAKERHLTCVAGLTPVLRSLSQNTVILTILGAGLLLLLPATPTLYSRSLAAFTVTLEPGLLAGNLSL